MSDPQATDREALHDCPEGECEHTEHEVESIEAGRCGPLLYGGPCWLMPGHRGPHHCYAEDIEAVVDQAITEARAEALREAKAVVEAAACEWERRAATCPCVGAFGHPGGVGRGPYCGSPHHAQRLAIADALRAALSDLGGDQ